MNFQCMGHIFIAHLEPMQALKHPSLFAGGQRGGTSRGYLRSTLDNVLLEKIGLWQSRLRRSLEHVSCALPWSPDLALAILRGVHQSGLRLQALLWASLLVLLSGIPGCTIQAVTVQAKMIWLSCFAWEERFAALACEPSCPLPGAVLLDFLLAQLAKQSQIRGNIKKN